MVTSRRDARGRYATSLPLAALDVVARVEVDELDRRAVRTLEQTYRLALMDGFTPSQAGNLTAWRDGMTLSIGATNEKTPERAWTVLQIRRMEFIRWLVQTRQIGSINDGR